MDHCSCSVSGALCHYAVRRLKKNPDHLASEKLATTLQNKNGEEFWKDVLKKTRGLKYVQANNMEGGEANCSLQCLNVLCNSVSYNDNDMYSLMQDIHSGIREGLSLNEIVTGVKCLKKGKRDSIPGFTTDNFINGTNKLNIFISMLLSSMISHGRCANDFLKTTVIPIPKSSRKSTNS
jgi:hypothetical protein